MRLLLYLFYPILILVILGYFFIINKQTKFTLRTHFKFLFLSTLSFFVLGNIILFVYFKNEQFIYYWDYATFWEQSLRINKLISENSRDAFLYVIDSMNYQEYTALPALFISLPTSILGQSFFAFILSSFNFFVIPFYIFLSIFELELISKLNLKFISNWLLFVCNFLFIPFYFTLFHGYIGVVGQIFIVSLFLIYITKNHKLDLPEVLIINSLTLLLIFTRRWYLFWVVSYYLSSGLFILLDIRKSKMETIRSISKLVMSGVLMLIIILVFFYPYFSALFVSNFSDLYASYKLPSLVAEFLRFKSYYGLFIILLFIYGLYSSISKSSTILWFVLIVTTLTAMQFLYIQSFEYHHYNLISFGIFVFVLITILELNHLKSVKFLVLTLYIFNSIYVFIPKLNLLNTFFSSTSLKPKFRDDIVEIQDLSNYLNMLTSENKYAYSAASSPILNDDLLRNSQLPWIMNSVPNLEGSSNNDIRDGFPISFFEVNYVLVTNPVQINASYIDKQFINQLINNSVLYQLEIRNNYQLVYENRISGVDVYIFERVSEFNTNEKRYFYNELSKMYPESPHVYDKIIEEETSK